MHLTEDASVRSRGPGSRYLPLLCGLLLGYAVLGRPFAGLGIGFFYVGEAVLLVGLGALLSLRGWSGIFALPTMRWLLAFMVWGLLRTIPYISRYGVDAFRDAVIWGYATFAIIIFTLLLADPGRLRILAVRFGKFMRFYPYVMAPLFALQLFAASKIPDAPWLRDPGGSMVQVRGGEVMVHFAGALTLVFVGLRRKPGYLWFIALIGAAGLIFSVSRAGLLTLLTSAAVCFILFRRTTGLSRFLLIGFCFLLIALTFDVDLGLSHTARSVNATQILDNLLSTFTTETHTALNLTKQWRLNWWSEIIDYTVFGPYFLLGKGFGINLATSDGFQVALDQSLRSPHSIHFAILARAGVPGLLIWLGLQMSWGLTVFRAYLRARRVGEVTWVAFFAFLIAYWVAFLVNASFDVYLEGPMGGIWFWTVFGFGLAATQIFYTAPEVLDGLELDENSPPA